MIEEILKALPQTQCEECGYRGCRPYAEAIAKGESINLCAPGGLTVLKRLEEITDRQGDPQVVKSRYTSPKIAHIDQDVCIGCTKCIAPCPTNAIVGNKKLNHVVLASDCTGCGLCVPYCPVDCITMEEDLLSSQGKLSLSDEFRALYEQKQSQSTERVLTQKTQDQLQADLSQLFGEGDESS